MYSILKFFQVDITGMFRMTSFTRYFKEGVGSSRPTWRWIMCFLERPKANTSCKAWPYTNISVTSRKVAM